MIELQLVWFDANQKPIASEMITFTHDYADELISPESGRMIKMMVGRAGQNADYPTSIYPLIKPVPGAKYLKIKVLSGDQVFVRVTIV